jgi:hypothetical protein
MEEVPEFHVVLLLVVEPIPVFRVPDDLGSLPGDLFEDESRSSVGLDLRR